jgi:uncharacterized integral membrane protein
MDHERSTDREETEADIPRAVAHGDEVADAEHMRQLGRVRQARLGKLIAVVVILTGLIVFVLQNSQPVPVELLFATIRPRLIWVLLACAVLGGIAGYLIARPSRKTRLHKKERVDRRRG